MASIIVVGGGLAGLACAWKLERAGHEVELLDRRRSASAGDPPAAAEGAGSSDAEAAWLRTADVDVRAAAAALGIPCGEGPADSDTFLCEGRFTPLPPPTLATLLRAPGGSRRRRLRWALGVLAPARAAARRASVLAASDGASFEAVLSRALGDDPLVARLGALAGLACEEAPARLSHATGLAALADCVVGSRPLLLEGGLARLRRALAASLTVRRGCDVVAVETESAGARVRYRTQGRLRSVLADAAVVALPAPELLRCCPKLTPEERGFFAAVEHAPDLSIRLTLERRPLPLSGLRIGFPAPDATLRSLVAMHRQPGAPSAGRCLLVARLAVEPSRRLASAPDAELQEVALAALAGTPLGRLRPLALTVERPASPRPLFGPGAVERIARFERRMERSPRLAFAGRPLLGPGPGAAFTSGLRAATDIARALQPIGRGRASANGPSGEDERGRC